MINLAFYGPIFDSTNMVTTEVVEEINPVFGHGQTTNIYEDNRPNFSFNDAIKTIKERIKYMKNFVDPLKQTYRWRVVTIGRGLKYASISESKSVLDRFKSMFSTLDSKTVTYLYMSEIGELEVDFCYTTFYSRKDILEKNIETYWDDALATYIDKFVAEENCYRDFLCDIVMKGSVSGYIRNVKVSPCLKDLLVNREVKFFNGFPFHFDGIMDMENGTHYFIEVDYRQIINKRNFEGGEYKSYFERGDISDTK